MLKPYPPCTSPSNSPCCTCRLRAETPVGQLLERVYTALLAYPAAATRAAAVSALLQDLRHWAAVAFPSDTQAGDESDSASSEGGLSEAAADRRPARPGPAADSTSSGGGGGSPADATQTGRSQPAASAKAATPPPPLTPAQAAAQAAARALAGVSRSAALAKSSPATSGSSQSRPDAARADAGKGEVSKTGSSAGLSPGAEHTARADAPPPRASRLGAALAAAAAAASSVTKLPAKPSGQARLRGEAAAAREAAAEAARRKAEAAEAAAGVVLADLRLLHQAVAASDGWSLKAIVATLLDLLGPEGELSSQPWTTCMCDIY